MVALLLLLPLNTDIKDECDRIRDNNNGNMDIFLIAVLIPVGVLLVLTLLIVYFVLPKLRLATKIRKTKNREGVELASSGSMGNVRM